MPKTPWNTAPKNGHQKKLGKKTKFQNFLKFCFFWLPSGAKSTVLEVKNMPSLKFEIDSGTRPISATRFWWCAFSERCLQALNTQPGKILFPEIQN